MILLDLWWCEVYYGQNWQVGTHADTISDHMEFKIFQHPRIIGFAPLFPYPKWGKVDLFR